MGPGDGGDAAGAWHWAAFPRSFSPQGRTGEVKSLGHETKRVSTDLSRQTEAERN